MRYILLLPLLLSGCGIMPYKSDFDCPHPEGEACKSLYEVNKLADSGKYKPDAISCECGPICRGNK